MPYTYFGEAAGARILRYGIGFTQIGDAYNFDAQTHELRPAGETGDVVFRTIDVEVRHRLGFAVEITPFLDGVAQQPQLFSGPAPPIGQFEQVVILQAAVGTTEGARGSAVSARVRSTQLFGETEIVNVQASFAVIRATP